MDVKQYKKVFAELQGCKRRIAKERDKLRDLVAEIGELEYSCERATSSLEDAADALSELL